MRSARVLPESGTWRNENYPAGSGLRVDATIDQSARFGNGQKAGTVLSEVAFVGGCATALLVTDPAAAQPRVTFDVDVIVEVASYAEYARLSRRLRALGFSEDSTEGAPLCRWVSEGMKLDVMPTNEKILGFSNRWYSAALRHAHELRIDDLQLRVVTAPYFIATKLEAFRGRGGGDFFASRDLEDIVALADGRTSLLDELKEAPAVLRAYIAREIRKLLATPEFVDSLPGHLPGDNASQARIPALLRTLESLSTLRSQMRKHSRVPRAGDKPRR